MLQILRFLNKVPYPQFSKHTFFIHNVPPLTPRLATSSVVSSNSLVQDSSFSDPLLYSHLGPVLEADDGNLGCLVIGGALLGVRQNLLRNVSYLEDVFSLCTRGMLLS